jgi:hypothetical protein
VMVAPVVVLGCIGCGGTMVMVAPVVVLGHIGCGGTA